MYKKILLINPFGIGDVLFTTPIIHTLKDTFSHVKIGYLCNRRTAPLIENNPHIDFLFIYERDEFEEIKKKSFWGWLKSINTFLGKIKKEHFELAIDFSLNSQYAFFCWCCGIKQRVGFNYKKRGFFLTRKINLSGYSQKHVVDYYADLLKYLRLDSKYKNLELYLKEADRKHIDELLISKGVVQNDVLVGIIPGAGKSWGKEAYFKHWPPEKFALLADKIIEKYGVKVIIMGDLSESEVTKAVVKNMSHEVIDISGKTSVGELAALIFRMKLVITNDGGPLHMAVALGIKTISFFGPVDPKVYGPYPASDACHIVLKNSLECSPCYQNFRLAKCQKDKECLSAISVEQAIGAVSKLL